MDKDWEIISCYTRHQAIEDGVLIDVTEQAKRIGFKVNTCVTDNLFSEYVTPPANLEGEGQSIEGRLQDLLFRTLIAASTMGGTDRVEFVVLFLVLPEARYYRLCCRSPQTQGLLPGRDRSHHRLETPRKSPAAKAQACGQCR